MSDSVSYSRIADRYEQVRGGDVRADELAAAIEGWLPSGVVCDVGAGTRVVTERLRRPGREMLAVDVSFDMLSRSMGRLPGRAAVADSSRLPLASASVDAITFVWVLHHVGDLVGTFEEARRVLRPGGRVVAVSGLSVPVPDDMGAIVERLNDELRPDRVRQAHAVPKVAASVGFGVVHRGMARTTASVSPHGLAEAIEQRLFSHLWDLGEAHWSALVEPAVDQLRALPDPDRERDRVFDHPLVVLDR